MEIITTAFIELEKVNNVYTDLFEQLWLSLGEHFIHYLTNKNDDINNWENFKKIYRSANYDLFNTPVICLISEDKEISNLIKFDSVKLLYDYYFMRQNQTNDIYDCVINNKIIHVKDVPTKNIIRARKFNLLELPYEFRYTIKDISLTYEYMKYFYLFPNLRGLHLSANYIVPFEFTVDIKNTKDIMVGATKHVKIINAKSIYINYDITSDQDIHDIFANNKQLELLTIPDMAICELDDLTVSNSTSLKGLKICETNGYIDDDFKVSIANCAELNTIFAECGIMIINNCPKLKYLYETNKTFMDDVSAKNIRFIMTEKNTKHEKYFAKYPNLVMVYYLYHNEFVLKSNDTVVRGEKQLVIDNEVDNNAAVITQFEHFISECQTNVKL
jgi:hypothetical protein